MYPLLSCGIIQKCLFLEGQRGGIVAEGLCLLQLWKSHYSPSSRVAETHTKTVELIGFFGRRWLTASSPRKTNVPDGKRPSLAQTSLCLGAEDQRQQWELEGGSCFFSFFVVVVKKNPQEIYLPPSNSFSQVFLLSLQNRTWMLVVLWCYRKLWKVIIGKLSYSGC